MSLFATIVLAYFFLRQIAFVVQAHRDGHSIIWTAVGSATALSLLVPLWLVWS